MIKVMDIDDEIIYISATCPICKKADGIVDSDPAGPSLIGRISCNLPLYCKNCNRHFQVTLVVEQ